MFEIGYVADRDLCCEFVPKGIPMHTFLECKGKSNYPRKQIVKSLPVILIGLCLSMCPGVAPAACNLILPSSGYENFRRCTAVVQRLFEHTGSAHVGPVAAQVQAVFDVGVVVLQGFAGGAAIDVLLGQINEVLISVPALSHDA